MKSSLTTFGRAAARNPAAVTVVAALLGISGFVATVSAVSGAAPTATTPLALSAKGGKLSPRLAALSSQGSFTASRAQLKALSVPATGVGSIAARPDGRVLVELRVSSTTPAVVAHLRALGAQVVNVNATYATVTAAVLPTALAALAADPSVVYANEVLAPRVARMDGAVRHSADPTPSVCAPIVSEGDDLMHVADARAHNNLDGTGETIGILSDSFDTDTSAATHAADDVAGGELPGAGNPCGRTNPVVVQSDSSANDPIDEGRAMAQLAHGLAPGANLAFATANNGELDAASQIANLRNVNHASVIVDDVSYIDEPFFQDGPIATAAKAATAAGVPYFSAAGNANVIVGGNNVSSYEAPSLRPVSCPAAITAIESATCHNFDTTGGTDTGDDITLAPGGSFGVDLQWAQPWGGVTSDYDIFIVNAAGNVVGGSNALNKAFQKPYEFAGVENTSASPATFHIVVALFGGGATPRFKFVLMGADGVTGVEYNASTGGDIVGPSIFGHNGAATIGSTAAVPFDNSNTSEDYSSRGPETLYFQPTPSTTALVTPQVVQQPAFAATDGVQTSFFGELDSGTWRFFGTSAAAPQAAAIGALLQEKDPALTPAQLISTLASTAQAVGTNGTSDAVGGGYLDADAALAAVTALPGVPKGVTAAAGNAQATVSWSPPATDPNFPLTGNSITPIAAGVAQTPRPVSPGATSQLITGLTNGVSYTFTVAASNANGPGPVSQPSVAITVGAPAAPASVSAVPAHSTAVVKWTAPTQTNGRPITGYIVNAYAGGSFIAAHPFNSTATTQTFTGLADGTFDTFTVAAINANGTGPMSAPSSVIIIGTPPAPTILTIAPIDGGLTVTWKAAPTPAGEQPINSYILSVYRDGTTLVQTDEDTFRSSGTGFGLTNGTAYALTILATNGSGNGPPSPLTQLVVAGSPTAPRTPTAKTGNAAATVSWKAPASTNGSAVTGYVVTPYLAGVAQTPRAFAGAATTRNVTGLVNGKRYTFKVAAQNARGKGLSSGATAAVTIGIPGAPTGVTAKAGKKSATVHWVAPPNNGGAITSYLVTPYKSGVAQTAQSFAGNATTRTIKGLATGKSYAFRVTAVNARGTGPASAMSAAVKIT